MYVEYQMHSSPTGFRILKTCSVPDTTYNTQVLSILKTCAVPETAYIVGVQYPQNMSITDTVKTSCVKYA
jgi:hypothetical protein